ncbi:hypothetical protein ABZ345_37065 [Lentzea sp. NPDC005914]|uniref:PKD domain-containing protein n=1 Tax=Lentzea sp. NPDC005914 TaxID=3154572 RepID=UPI0033FA7A4E
MRTFIAAAAAVLAAALVPGIALAAEAPANDDFDNATTITALPFSAKVTTAGATKATDDPTACNYWGQSTIWLHYTAQEDGLLRASSPTGPPLGVYTGTRGALTLVPGACSYDTGLSNDIFPVKAGTTYHIALIESYASNGHEFTFDLAATPYAANDNRAAATVAGFPSTLEGDLRRASAEPDEVTASCAPEATQSVWYRYTPERTRSVHVGRAAYQSTVLSAHRASDLSELDCQSKNDYYGLVFTATAGETYLIRVADDVQRAGSFELDFANAPAIRPAFNLDPEQPSVFDDVEFDHYAGDPLARELVSGEIQFGDGFSAPITGPASVHHRYAKDGSYPVRITGSTKDGRTGTTTRTINVTTHDVTLSSPSVPASAKAGETKRIKVSVGNTRYDERVRVELRRLSVYGYYETVANLEQQVVASANGKVEFPFAYTYTADDAKTGKVTFKLVAMLPGHYEGDANPADNEILASTAVRSAGGSAKID